jgi:hypothetical protein
MVAWKEQRVKILMRRDHWRQCVVFSKVREVRLDELSRYANGVVLEGVQTPRDLSDDV